MEQISHSSRFGNHLGELWQFWGRLRALTAAAEPNGAHLALAAAQDACEAAGGWLVVATQNVDGLHTAAGSRDVVELHGSIHRSRCIKRGCSAAFDDIRVPEEGTVPACEKCGRPVRPDVVLFGEQLSGRQVRELQKKLRDADLCVYVGTSGNVWPAADLVSTARLGGARCVLVNAEAWDHPHPDFHETVLGSADVLLPRLFHSA